jgi:S1-C subfamily serine protease
VRIEVVGCTDSGIGTGFLISPTLIVTVAHVVDQSVVVSLVDRNQRTTGSVLGIDPSRDLALVRAASPLTGYHFKLAQTLPQPGDPVAAIGFPIGDPITVTQGHISGLHRDISVEGTPRSNLIETDTAINPGNSGGPLLDQQGAVVGLVDAKNVDAEGIGYAVPATEARRSVSVWHRNTSLPTADCSDPLGPSQTSAQVPRPPGLGRGAAAGDRDDVRDRL